MSLSLPKEKHNNNRLKKVMSKVSVTSGRKVIHMLKRHSNLLFGDKNENSNLLQTNFHVYDLSKNKQPILSDDFAIFHIPEFIKTVRISTVSHVFTKLLYRLPIGDINDSLGAGYSHIFKFVAENSPVCRVVEFPVIE